MNTKYTLENAIGFEELCKIVCMVKRQGYKVNDYLVNNDSDYMEVYFSNKDQSFSINDNGHSINMQGFSPEEALEQFKCIIDNVEKEKTND